MGASLITRQPRGLALGLPALTNRALGASLALLPGSNKAVGWQCGGMVGWWDGGGGVGAATPRVRLGVYPQSPH